MDFALVLILARFGVSCVEHVINKQYFRKKSKQTIHVEHKEDYCTYTQTNSVLHQVKEHAA
jgi:hypothetical protein